MHSPLRIGQVHGLALVFSALRPALVVYILCLVLETCTARLLRRYQRYHDTTVRRSSLAVLIRRHSEEETSPGRIDWQTSKP
eukprot:3886074-Prymnesium_polylepis.1